MTNKFVVAVVTAIILRRNVKISQTDPITQLQSIPLINNNSLK